MSDYELTANQESLMLQGFCGVEASDDDFSSKPLCRYSQTVRI